MILGTPIDRVDGHAKVTGRAKYAYEFATPGLVIRDADAPGGRFGIRPFGSLLGFTAERAAAIIESSEDGAIHLGTHGLVDADDGLRGNRHGNEECRYHRGERRHRPGHRRAAGP